MCSIKTHIATSLLSPPEVRVLPKSFLNYASATRTYAVHLTVASLLLAASHIHTHINTRMHAQKQ